MADMTIKTRIQLKHDSYENWLTNNPTLNKGEVAIATIPSNQDGVQNAPSVLIKVGDGTSDYKTLKFVSGLAADVHGWAKEANKPVYAASEITGMDSYISEYVNEQMGISVDTDTVYRLVKVDDYNYKLQSKGKNDEAWGDVTGSTISIPNDTAAIKALQDLVGNTAVATQIANAISALDLANTYAAKVHGHVIDDVTGLQAALDSKQAAGDYATKAEAQAMADAKEEAIAAAQKSGTDAMAEAQAKVASIAAGDNSMTIGGTATAPIISAKLSQDADNALELAEDGLKVVIPTAAEYTIEKAAESGEYAAVYALKKDGVQVGASINIPKDMVVESGSVVENPEGQPAGTYIKLVLQNVAEPLYVNVGSLIEYVTSGSQTGDMVVVTISDEHKVTATISDGSITLGKLSTDIQTAIGKAHSHENAEVLAGINADKVAAWDAAEQNAKDHTNSLNETMDGRMKVVEGKAHEHANKDVLDGIAASDITSWNAKVDSVATTNGKGLKVSRAGNAVTIDIDEAVTFILDCGTSEI